MYEIFYKYPQTYDAIESVKKPHTYIPQIHTIITSVGSFLQVFMIDLWKKQLQIKYRLKNERSINKKY